jgi:hypothetical protein
VRRLDIPPRPWAWCRASSFCFNVLICSLTEGLDKPECRPAAVRLPNAPRWRGTCIHWQRFRLQI